MEKRISKICIFELFGMFNHEIPLHTTENITILHGQNGVGKTTILKIINALFNGKLFSLFNYSFKILRVEFTNDEYIELEKNITDVEITGHRILKFRGSYFLKEIVISEKDYHMNHRVHYGVFEECLPFIERIGPRTWFDRRMGARLNEMDIMEIYRDELALFNIDTPNQKKNEKAIEQVRQVLKTVRTHFIQTQRLFDETKTTSSPNESKSKITIEKNAVDLAEKIKDAIRNSGVRSASLDRTFPSRILTKMNQDNIDDEYIRNKFTKQNDYRNRLMLSGLIDEEEGGNLLPGDKLDAHALKVLWHYLNDVDEKFEVYKDLLPKIELFLSIINSRFRYKKMSISKNEGFFFISDSGQSIPLKSLSSGEQHELVLTYELIFKVPEKTLILIDEPELSLHVTWQQKFLTDIKRISQIANLDFIIATHSPSIVHEYRFLMEEIPSSIIEVYNV